VAKKNLDQILTSCSLSDVTAQLLLFDITAQPRQYAASKSPCSVPQHQINQHDEAKPKHESLALHTFNN
jgi:hypothetical protein